MDQNQAQLVKKSLDIFFRRKKFIASCVIISIVVGLGMYLKTPKTYQSKALIQYQQQKITPTRMAPDVQTRIKDMVNTVSQQITSRTSLEELIKQFDLYPGARQTLPIEDLVATMRDHHISIQQGKGEIFEVAFQGRNPNKVVKITNALAAKFIEENLRFREERASETSAYIKDELNMAKVSLDKIEEVMRDYKLKFYNEMPQQLNINMARLNALQTQYQNNQSNNQSLEQTKILVQEQITIREEMLSQAARLAGGNSLSPGSRLKRTDPIIELAEMRQKLSELQTRYTDKHPEIRKYKKLIEQKEKNISQSPSGQVEKRSENQVESNRTGFFDPQLEQLHRQFKEIEFNLGNLKKERGEIINQIEKFKKWVAAAPVCEVEWSALTRDYNQLNDHYQKLVASNIQAKSVQSLERRQKGSQFRIVDPAHYPEKPFKPDFFRMMLIAIVVGLSIGGGISFILASLDSSFTDVNDIEPYLGMPVACSIPYIYTTAEKNKNRIKSILWAATFVTSIFIIIGGVIYLYQKGMIII